MLELMELGLVVLQMVAQWDRWTIRPPDLAVKRGLSVGVGLVTQELD